MRVVSYCIYRVKVMESLLRYGMNGACLTQLQYPILSPMNHQKGSAPPISILIFFFIPESSAGLDLRFSGVIGLFSSLELPIPVHVLLALAFALVSGMLSPFRTIAEVLVVVAPFFGVTGVSAWLWGAWALYHGRPVPIPVLRVHSGSQYSCGLSGVIRSEPTTPVTAKLHSAFQHRRGCLSSRARSSCAELPDPRSQFSQL
ncbi:hypothetical protein QBC37DRAFT_434767, partial [Rhypophila decipiens]